MCPPSLLGLTCCLLVNIKMTLVLFTPTNTVETNCHVHCTIMFNARLDKKIYNIIFHLYKHNGTSLFDSSIHSISKYLKYKQQLKQMQFC